MMKHNIRQLLNFLLIIMITSLFCVGLYHLNNKYTNPGPQPDHGQFVLAESTLHDLHFLINDWEFYPDVLLTPDQLTAQNSEPYMYYTDIGTSTILGHSQGETNPHGSGTYALHLWLPHQGYSYTLELPEIFSAYRLYINGEEYLHSGNPDPASYDARTQTKMVSFYAQDYAEILISITDYSHFYSGMVYPPAFGLSSTVTQYRDLKIASGFFALTVCLILMLVTLYLGITLQKRNAFLFCLLALDTCFVLGLPILHMLTELPVFPWYALELFCIYLMIPLVLILHNRICEVPHLYNMISVSLTVGFCILSACYGLCAASLTVSMMRLYSGILIFYKLSCACYLLLTAVQALYIGNFKARPLFYATTVYSVFYLWDRILPDYEPIYLGWFSDWGNLFLLSAIGYCLANEMVVSYIRSLSFREEHRQITRQLLMQEEYTRQLTEHMEKKRRMIHDFRQHLHTIRGLAEAVPQKHTKHFDELITYIDELSQTTLSKPEESLISFSDNPSVDALLQYYYSLSEQLHIKTVFQLLPFQVELSDIELCTILGNLLENAVEACRKIPESQERSITLHSMETSHMLFIRIENTYDGIFRCDPETGFILSRKEKSFRYGIGMESVREIVQQHGGTLDIYPKEAIFRVGISLPLK